MPDLRPFHIRPVAREEAVAWRALRLGMLRDSPTAFSSSYEDAVKDSLETFALRIPEGGINVLFGVFVGGELCGSAGFSRDWGLKVAHKGFMWSVYVQPALRGRGVGEALVTTVMDHARANAVTVLRCSVTSTNTVACALYRRLGFIRYGVEARAICVAGQDYDEDLLAINLD